MKKLPKLIVCCLASLSVVGCTQKNSSSVKDSEPITTSSNTSNTASSNPSSSLPASSQPSSSLPDSSEKPASSSSTSSSNTSSSISSSEEQETGEWNSSTKTLMDKFLYGKTVPYVNLGTSYLSSYRNTLLKSTSGIRILGDTFDVTKLDGFKNTFETAGWSVTTSSSLLSATKDDLSVKISKDEESSDFVMDIFYDIPYDETKAGTAWDSQTKLEMEASLNNHEVPYIYLGTPECYTDFMDATKTLNVYGFNFNAKIITNARAALTQDGWTIKDTTGTYGPGLVAEKEFSSDTLTVTLSTPAPGDGSRYYITIKLSETWNPDGATNWQSSDIQTFTEEFDEHVPDYFYLGTNLPYLDDFSDRYKRITINGGLGDERIIPLAKQTLSSKGWSVSESNGALTASKTYDDGCSLRIEIPAFYSTSVRMYAYVYYVPKLTLPSSDKQVWSDEVKSIFETKLNGNTLPYIYLGDEDVDAYFDKDLAKLTLKTSNHATFSTPKIVTNAEDVLRNDGYTLSISSNNYGDVFKATKTFENGDKFVVSMEAVGPEGRATLDVQYYEAFDATYTSTWASDRAKSDTGDEDTTSTKHLMDESLDSHAVPYVYLGAKSFSSSFDSSNKTLTVTGGRWDARILTNANTVFTKDGWTVTTNATDETDLASATNLTAVKNFDGVNEDTGLEDHCTLTATISKPTEEDTESEPVHTTKMTIQISSAWGGTLTDWGDDTKEGLSDIGLPSGFVPFFDLGSNDVFSYGATGNTVTTWCYLEFDSRVIDNFDAAMTKDGWTLCDNITYASYPLHSAKKEVLGTDGKALGIARISVGCSAEMGFPEVIVSYDKYANATLTPLTYTDAQKQLMKSSLDGTEESILPALVSGSAMDVTAIEGGVELTTASTVDSYTYNYAYTQSTMKAFSDASWTIKESNLFTYEEDGITKYGNFVAAKNTALGTLKAVCTAGKDPETYEVSFSVKVTYEEGFHAPTGEDAKYNEETTAAMKNALDGYVLPYLYLGKKEASLKVFTKTEKSNKVLSLTGKLWDDSIVASLKTALSNDTVITNWNILDISSTQSDYDTLVYATGTLKVTVPAVRDDKGEIIIEPEKEVLHTVSLKLYKDTLENGNAPVLEVYYK